MINKHHIKLISLCKKIHNQNGWKFYLLFKYINIKFRPKHCLSVRISLGLTRADLTCAPAALHVGFEGPAIVTGALHIELVLFTALAALQVFGTEALDLTRLVVGAQLHAQWARAQNSLARGHCTVMTAAAIVQRTQI